MSKTAALALAVWAAAVGSAGALAFTVSRPPRPVAAVTESRSLMPAPAADVVREQAPPALTDAPRVVIAHKVRVHPQPAASVPERHRDLSDMRCTPWESLTQGSASQKVRRCE